jgi:hypothetical protein
MSVEQLAPSAALSTTTPTRPDRSSNPDRRSGKPATNCLGYLSVTAESTRSVSHELSFEYATLVSSVTPETEIVATAFHDARKVLEASVSESQK